jgi:hypothetical protein
MDMFQKFINHKLVFILCGASLAFVLGGFLWACFALQGLRSPLLLHFAGLFGEVQVGGFGSVIGAGVLGLLVVLINSAVAVELDSRDAFLGKFTAALTLAFAVLLFIAAAAIISVN